MRELVNGPSRWGSYGACVVAAALSLQSQLGENVPTPVTKTCHYSYGRLHAQCRGLFAEDAIHGRCFEPNLEDRFNSEQFAEDTFTSLPLVFARRPVICKFDGVSTQSVVDGLRHSELSPPLSVWPVCCMRKSGGGAENSYVVHSG